ncbi:hypothetical protein RJ639_043018 [Escallonia herrerae]|uniref:peptidylprolyl isomerase n=1 Tax=Escallonia herrerae TaxID=1293975 RepID=A0AA88WB29_9ASTE|nr:hypothetical protein RJ639_043018 [Escallonia herrerae]
MGKPDGKKASPGKKEEEKAEAMPFQVRSFPNGLVIEELVMGKPDGKKASPGKKVSIHYIGKLKKNGIGKVIKGWDIGVNGNYTLLDLSYYTLSMCKELILTYQSMPSSGMRIGYKRRLTIPPAMGYSLSLSLSKSND